MPDMLVKLYDLPDLAPSLARQDAAGITVRRALAPEKHLVVDWVRAVFKNVYWPAETDVSFSRLPLACFIATQAGRLIGFACYDAIARGLFGPTGVSEAARGHGTGTALLLACLHDMRAQGYGYAVIGAVGPAEFYAKAVGATLIEGSEGSLWRGMLRDQ